MLSPASTAHGSPEVTDARSSPDPRPVFYQQRLDYCNGILVGITDQLMQRLQAVQNAAARLIVGARKFNPVCATYIGCQSDNASPSSSAFWPTNASAAWPTIPVRVSCADIVASQWSTAAALVFEEFTPRAADSHMLRRLLYCFIVLFGFMHCIFA